MSRRRIDSGVSIATITYVQTGEAPPCAVSFGGTTRVFDVLGLRSWPANDAQRLAATLSELFPLEVGKRARLALLADAQRAGGTQQWSFTFEVLRRERIQVPAGSFSAFVIRLTQQGMAGNMLLEERAVWIDEATLLPLRMQRRLIRGLDDEAPADWEATSVRPRPRGQRP